MIALRLVALLCLVFLINSNPIDQESSSLPSIRHRRNLNFLKSELINSIYKRFSRNRNYQKIDDIQSFHIENLSESRPVEGPINIEHLPAMLAARQVKNYPFSQQDDPAVIGR